MLNGVVEASKNSKDPKRISSCRYYTWLGLVEVWRFPAAWFVTSLVVAGICLPLLLIAGLKRGLVTNIENGIKNDPTACQINIWVVREGTALSDKDLRALAQADGVAAVIPEITKVLTMKTPASPSQNMEVTFLASQKGDPFLRAHRADMFGDDDQGIILSKSVADKLQLKEMDRVVLEILRNEGALSRTVTLEVPIRKIVAFGAKDKAVAYAHRNLLDMFESFQFGEAIPKFNWPSFLRPVRPTYAGYLCFSEKEYSDKDQLYLKSFGLQALTLSHTDPRHCLYGLFTPETPPFCYLIQAEISTADKTYPLSKQAEEIERITEADDVAIPWNDPLCLECGRERALLIGCTLEPHWLRAYFKNSNEWFSAAGNEFGIRFLTEQSHIPGSHSNLGVLRLDPDASVPVSVMSPTGNCISMGSGDPNDPAEQQDPETQEVKKPILMRMLPEEARGEHCDPNNKPNLALIPSEFLAHLHQWRRGEARLDHDVRMFIPPPQIRHYYRARIYAHTFYDVPELDAKLSKTFSTQSSRARIKEAENRFYHLSLLVKIVTFVVFVFGLITVASLLSDVAARKKGTIGVLRVMGVPKWAIFYFIVIRATLTGILGGALAYVSSIGISRILNSCHRQIGIDTAEHLSEVVSECEGVPVRHLVNHVSIIEPKDFLLIILMALLCCWLGCLFPAWAASRQDPIQNVLEQKVR